MSISWPFPARAVGSAPPATRRTSRRARAVREEASGLIRWLRPDYQNPGGTQSHQPSLAVEASEEKAKVRSAKEKAKLPWPKSLSERVKAVSAALFEYKEPVTPETIAKRFKRADPATVAEILETLCTMGHAHRGKTEHTYLP